MQKGIPVHKIKNYKLDGFIGFMPQVPRRKEIIYLGTSAYMVKEVVWVNDPIPKEWEARLELEYICG